MDGLHLIAEWYDCAAGALALDRQALSNVCSEAVTKAGLTEVAQAFHTFPAGGVTGVVVLAESHVALHTWPERQAVTLDIYVCNFSRDNRDNAHQLYQLLEAVFQPGASVLREVERGERV